MAAVDFNKALETKASEVKAVPIPPTGHYIFQVTGVPAIVTDQRWQRVDINVRAVSVYEDANDVDSDELSAYGKVTSITNRVSFMFDSEEGTETDLIRFQNQVKRFCADHLKIEGAEDMSLKQMLNAAVNKRFVGQIVHKADKRDSTGETMQANISRTAPVEA